MCVCSPLSLRSSSPADARARRSQLCPPGLVARLARGSEERHGAGVTRTAAGTVSRSGGCCTDHQAGCARAVKWPRPA